MAVVAVKVIALDKGSQERSGAYLQNRISLLRMRVGTGANLYVNAGAVHEGNKSAGHAHARAAAGNIIPSQEPCHQRCRRLR